MIGRFCAFATGVRIFMNGANHAMGGFSTYPFDIFGHGWERASTRPIYAAESRGDTVIGPDVWIGYEALILPGARIGAGAVVGARAVVAGEVPPYAIVVGQPGAGRCAAASRTTRWRRCSTIAWWDWPVDRIGRNLDAIRGADIAALRAAR